MKTEREGSEEGADVCKVKILHICVVLQNVVFEKGLSNIIESIATIVDKFLSLVRRSKSIDSMSEICVFVVFFETPNTACENLL